MNTNTINLTFLGTGAADIRPELSGIYKNCFNEDARRCSAVLVDGDMLIDAGVHILESLSIAGIPMEQIRHLFVTHTHGDHFAPKNVAAIAAAREEPLHIWVSEDSTFDFSSIPNTVHHPMKAFESYTVGDIILTGVPANHAPLTTPQHLLIEKGERKMLYACDGAWFLYATYKFLEDKRINCLILDCTVGDYEGDFRMAEHNSIPMIRLMLPSLLKVRVMAKDAEIYLSHLAPSLHKSHAETVEIARGFGAHVAYDGLSITV